MNAKLADRPTLSRTSTAQTPNRIRSSILVDNEPGILARVIGLFSARGFNIDFPYGLRVRAREAHLEHRRS